MNTPTHVAMSVAILGNHNRPKDTAWIIWGALLPDLAMLPLFLFEILQGVTVDVIFDEKYFTPLWQNTINLFNSIPIYLVLLLIAWVMKWRGIALLCAAALLHIAFDLPLHNDDAHAHFFPLSNWQFHSPVSYWDPRHYGQWASIAEFFILIISCYFGVRVFVHRWAKIGFMAFSLFMPFMMALYFVSEHVFA